MLGIFCVLYMTMGRCLLSLIRTYKSPKKRYSYICGPTSYLFQGAFIPLPVLWSNKSQTFVSMSANMASSNVENVAQKTNRLALEKSPYLLQHAKNPVDWYPWCTEALEKAKKEDKLIFLSVGYSTCHWCHVMEKESFKNEEIAGIMNKNFVNIKVDKEERPDIDRIYMTFVQVSN